MFSCLLFFLFWAKWAVSADSGTLPATVEIDIVFPLNQTYTLIDPFPVIFVIQNATVAWRFGFTLEWNITGVADGDSFTDIFGSGFLFGGENPVHPVPPPDPYIVVNSTRFPTVTEKVPAGKWTLGWSYSASPCTQSGNIIDIDLTGEVVAQGSLSFTVEAGGASPDFTSSCPTLAGQVGMMADLLGCPQLGTPNASNPCGAKVDAAQASSISAVLGLGPPISSATGGSSASGATGILTMSGSSASGATSTSTTGATGTSATSASITSTTNIAGREQLRSGLLGAAAGIAGLGILLL
jgi:hypothetical protein